MDMDIVIYIIYSMEFLAKFDRWIRNSKIDLGFKDGQPLCTLVYMK